MIHRVGTWPLTLALVLAVFGRREARADGAQAPGDAARLHPAQAGPGSPAPADLSPTPEEFILRLRAVEDAEDAAHLVRCGGPSGAGRRRASCDDPCVATCPRISISLGAWIWGLSGTLGSNDRDVDVESDWTDTLENVDKLEFALNARVRAEFGRWSATVEVDGATVADSATFREGPLQIDAEARAWMLQAHVGYHLAGGRLGCGECAPTWCLGAYAGVRASWVDLELDRAPGGAVVDRSLDWLDPIVGLRGELNLSDRWFGLAEVDVGGFGVGSDLAWHLVAAVGYRLSEGLAVSAGWKLLDTDYEEDGAVWDVRMSGPFLALTVSF